MVFETNMGRLETVRDEDLQLLVDERKGVT
jgi:hypothetical protein